MAQGNPITSDTDRSERMVIPPPVRSPQRKSGAGGQWPEGVFRLRERSLAPAARAHASFPFGMGVRGVHEIADAGYGDRAVSTAFAGLAARACGGPVFWITEAALARDLGRLSHAGLCPANQSGPRVIEVCAGKPSQALWCIEEIVQSGAAGLVVAEISGADFTATRRLMLASERCGVPVVLILPHTQGGASASLARWRIGPVPSCAHAFDPMAPGLARWSVVMERHRDWPMRAGEVFVVDFDHDTFSVDLVSGLAADADVPQGDRSLPQTSVVVPFARYG